MIPARLLEQPEHPLGILLDEQSHRKREVLEIGDLRQEVRKELATFDWANPEQSQRDVGHRQVVMTRGVLQERYGLVKKALWPVTS
ncbi:MAG: hypothetical protein HY319_20130 [Armatimonadetes bacterium]|nr:hypothetical protein [Armatimonadota bacterium]